MILVLCLLGWWGSAVPGVPGGCGDRDFSQEGCSLQHISCNQGPAQQNRCLGSSEQPPLQGTNTYKTPLNLYRGTLRNRFAPK